jgi:hypothetical protein
MKFTGTRKHLFVHVLALLIFLSLLDACTSRKKKIRRLEDFDSEVWMADKSGCNGDRMDLRDKLLASKYFMRGLKSGQIIDILGSPDAQELYNRSQQYYIYFLEPGPKCDNAKNNPLALFIRFSAVGIANEFTIRELEATTTE